MVRVDGRIVRGALKPSSTAPVNGSRIDMLGGIVARHVACHSMSC